MAEEGIESTLAGLASRLSSDTMAACVYCAIISPLSTPGVVGEEGGGQTVIACCVEEAVGSAFADPPRDIRGHDGEEVQDVSHGSSVEVTVRPNPSVESDDGIVDSTGQFAPGNQSGVIDGVACAAGDLRCAPQ